MNRRLGTRIYATRHGCGDRAGALAVAARLRKMLDAWYEQGRIQGYRVTSPLQEDDIEDYDVPDDILSAYMPVPPPFVYCSVTYDIDASPFPTPQETRALEEDFKLDLAIEG